MSMFFGLQKMPTYYSDTLANGGLLWFPDLSVPDPMYILPLLSSATFLATIELGQKSMAASSGNQGQTKIFITVFRGMAILMIPVTIQFPAAVLCYWVTNNIFTFFQSAVFQIPAIRNALGIWELPKPVPGAPEPKGVQEMIKELMEQRQKIADMAKKEEADIKARSKSTSNSDVEILEGEIVNEEMRDMDVSKGDSEDSSNAFKKKKKRNKK